MVPRALQSTKIRTALAQTNEERMNDKQIIEAQKKQLEQLRNEVRFLRQGGVVCKDGNAGGQDSSAPAEVRELNEKFYCHSDGKTVGIKIDEGTRARLDKQRERFEAKAHRAMVLTCMELGLRQLEEMKDAEPSVETVPDVQRSGDQGDHPLRAVS